MTKREMMVKAHGLARKMIGDYAARLSLALRQLWASIKGAVSVNKMEEMLSKLQYRTTPLSYKNQKVTVFDSVTGKGVKITEIKEVLPESRYGRAVVVTENGLTGIAHAPSWIGRDHIEFTGFLYSWDCSGNMVRSQRRPIELTDLNDIYKKYAGGELK